MKRVSMPCSLLIMAFALACLPAGLRAQSENLISATTINEYIASSEASETQSGKDVVPESQPRLQPGTLEAAGRARFKSWSMPIPTGTPCANRKSWICAGPGSLPLAVTIQPDATQKYGTSPGILQIYFGHRP
jgi:hypothetical protein